MHAMEPGWLQAQPCCKELARAQGCVPVLERLQVLLSHQEKAVGIPMQPVDPCLCEFQCLESCLAQQTRVAPKDGVPEVVNLSVSSGNVCKLRVIHKSDRRPFICAEASLGHEQEVLSSESARSSLFAAVQEIILHSSALVCCEEHALLARALILVQPSQPPLTGPTPTTHTSGSISL